MGGTKRQVQEIRSGAGVCAQNSPRGIGLKMTSFSRRRLDDAAREVRLLACPCHAQFDTPPKRQRLSGDVMP